MYKYIIMGILSFLFASKELDAQFKSVYDFKVESLDGGTIDLSKYKIHINIFRR